MKVECCWIGKTQEPYLEEGLRTYEKRLKHYLPFEVVLISDIRSAGKCLPEEVKRQEGERILSRLKPEDYLVLLDEKGQSFPSVQFARWMDQRMQMTHKRLIFQVGGAFGFSEEVYKRANAKLSLSEMTFSHQMVRLFFLEQLYRAMTILRNEPYHNE
ncbi:MAG: 23S rRNA (pseudouridine(1915)-N(3))-methyltransferase RlmH [Haliscomenobacter sp.]|nr:23S rRNA (pseudouridine(1915)-N(3))-methyltransferase RlmH [Haliscomenobacter sp.]MBK7474723.1 23S rRNA (pseudouridine(1915)-N(3))-methyltransferase RlmH [Haliscomenobacter sp.]MBK8877627.1 23S rRNA (pseudouridine(1915)-N(3))-methyltransferase RlmH [Haliscomenobacter sp.]